MIQPSRLGNRGRILGAVALILNEILNLNIPAYAAVEEEPVSFKPNSQYSRNHWGVAIQPTPNVYLDKIHSKSGYRMGISSLPVHSF